MLHSITENSCSKLFTIEIEFVENEIQIPSIEFQLDLYKIGKLIFK